MTKYRIVFKYRNAQQNNPSISTNYDIERKDWFFGSWNYVGSVWFKTPKEAAQYENQLNHPYGVWDGKS